MIKSRSRSPLVSHRMKTKPARLPTSKASASKASNVKASASIASNLKASTSIASNLKASTTKADMEKSNLLNKLPDPDEKSSPDRTKKRRLGTQEQESIPRHDEESITYNIKVSNRFNPIEADDPNMDFLSDEELGLPPTKVTKSRKPPPIIV